MWQVSGRSNITDFEEVVKLDKQYISEWTMGLDICRDYRDGKVTKEDLDKCSTCDKNCVINNGLSEASKEQLKNNMDSFFKSIERKDRRMQQSDYKKIWGEEETWGGILDKASTIKVNIDMSILIVIFLVHNKLYEEDYLYMQNGVIFLGDNILEEVLKKGISETHLHFNAGMQYQYIWQNYMNPLKWDLYDRTNVIKYLYGKDRKENIPFHVVFYRTVFAEYLEKIQNYVSFNEFIKVQFCNEKVSVRNFLVKFAEGDTENCGEDISEIYNILRRYQKRYADAGQDFLMDMVYDRYKNLHTYGEMIFLFKSVKYFSIRGIDKDTIIEMRLFMQYLRCKNRLFRRILQSRPIYGLDYFQNKYRGVIENELALRLNQGQICHILFRSIHQNIFLKKYEIRLAIAELKESVDTKYQKEELKRRILKDIYVILKEYKKILEEALESEVPNMGIIFSFLKRDSIDNRIGDMCWLQYDETKINSKSIDHIILKRKRMKDSAEVLEELRSEIPFLNNYVVGIDTASIENRAEPWIFAPVYLAIRRQRITKPVMPINSKYAPYFKSE